MINQSNVTSRQVYLNPQLFRAFLHPQSGGFRLHVGVLVRKLCSGIQLVKVRTLL